MADFYALAIRKGINPVPKVTALCGSPWLEGPLGASEETLLGEKKPQRLVLHGREELSWM